MIELSKRLTDEQKRKSLIVLDNASYHKIKEVIKVYHDNKLKIIANIPYQSKFDGIEFFFGFLKICIISIYLIIKKNNRKR